MASCEPGAGWLRRSGLALAPRGRAVPISSPPSHTRRASGVEKRRG
uniref:Uncharacterized protein n=1 Tax=Arundo donax TaxID=35708 RepID=A0A0A9HP73_ARUDO